MNIKYNINIAFVLSILIFIHIDMFFSYLHFSILIRYMLLITISAFLYFIFIAKLSKNKSEPDISAEKVDTNKYQYASFAEDIKSILSQTDMDAAVNSYIHLMKNLPFVNKIGIQITDKQYFVDKTYGEYRNEFSKIKPTNIEIIQNENTSICVTPIKISDDILGYAFIELVDKYEKYGDIKERIKNKTYFLNFIIENNNRIKEYKNTQIYYYKLFNQNHFPMLLVNPENGEIVDCNEAALKLYGYTRSEILDLNISSINISSKEYIRAKMSEATLNTTVQFNFRHKLKSGEIINVQVSSGKILIDNKLLLFSIIQDISEEYEEKLNFEKFKSVVEQSPNRIVITNLNGDIEYVNPAFTSKTGYSLAEVYNKTPRVLKSGAQSDTLYEQLWEEISKGHTWEGEFINKRKDGSLFYEYAIITMIRDRESMPLGYLSIETDISLYKEINLNLIKRIGSLLETIDRLKNSSQESKKTISINVKLKAEED